MGGCHALQVISIAENVDSDGGEERGESARDGGEGGRGTGIYTGILECHAFLCNVGYSAL